MSQFEFDPRSRPAYGPSISTKHREAAGPRVGVYVRTTAGILTVGARLGGAARDDFPFGHPYHPVNAGIALVNAEGPSHVIPRYVEVSVLGQDPGDVGGREPRSTVAAPPLQRPEDPGDPHRASVRLLAPQWWKRWFIRRGSNDLKIHLVAVIVAVVVDHNRFERATFFDWAWHEMRGVTENITAPRAASTSSQ